MDALSFIVINLKAAKLNNDHFHITKRSAVCKVPFLQHNQKECQVEKVIGSHGQLKRNQINEYYYKIKLAETTWAPFFLIQRISA